MWSEYYKNFAQADKVQYQKKLIYPMGHYSPIRIKLKVAGSATFNIWLILHGFDIHIETPSEFTKHKLKAYKLLEAYNFFISGHVQDVGYSNYKHVHIWN